MHISETLFVGLLSVGVSVVLVVITAIIAGAKADGKRGSQLDTLIEGQRGLHMALSGVNEDVQEIKTQAAATDRTVAVHSEQIGHMKERVSGLERASARAQQHGG